jgi:hypothetical protein
MNKLSEALRELPAFDPPADGWLRLQHALQPRSRRRRSPARFALAASVLAAVGVAMLLPRTQVPVPDPELSRLMQQSRTLEQDLQRLRPQVVVWDGRYAATTTALENGIAVVDLQLNVAADAGARRLWQDRVTLLTQLVETHEAAGARGGALSAQQEWSL